MEIRRTPIGWPITGMLILCLGVLVGAGCSDDSSKPTPELEAMGGILIARGMPAGSPVQAGVVVSVDGQVVTDAVVRINETDLTYVENPAKPEETGYVGIVTAPAGTVFTLSVTAAGQTKTMQATVPGMVEIQSPTAGSVYADNADITVSWVPSTGAAVSIVMCAGSGSAAPGMLMLAGDAASCIVPANYTSPPGDRITVIGLNGSGDLPTSMDLRQWAGKNGFWVTCQDYVDVLVTS